jgi:hypothetical protein
MDGERWPINLFNIDLHYSYTTGIGGRPVEEVV